MVNFNFCILMFFFILNVISCIFCCLSGVEVNLRLMVLLGFVCLLFVSNIVIFGIFFLVCGKSCEVVSLRVLLMYVRFFLCGRIFIKLLNFFMVEYFLK